MFEIIFIILYGIFLFLHYFLLISLSFFFFLTLLMIKKMKYIACEMAVIAALLKFLFFV